MNFDRSKIYSCYDLEDKLEVLKFLGKTCYFSRDPLFKNYVKGKFSRVAFCEDIERNYFGCDISNEFGGFHYEQHRYLILGNDVETEKRFRPFENIEEFCNETSCEEVGNDSLTILSLKNNEEYTLLFTGYSKNEVHLGSFSFNFYELFNDYEYYDFNLKKFLKFGVEE